MVKSILHDMPADRQNDAFEDFDKPKQREILEKVRAGEPVEYNKFRIIDGLNFSSLLLPTEGINKGRRIISSPITITNSKIELPSCFSDLFFLKSVSFEDTTFDNDVTFEGSIFAQPPIFTNVHFKGDVSFHKAEFYEGVSFLGSIFKNDALFMNADFKKSALFEGAKFYGTTAFMDAHFRRDAKFTKSTFFRDANFHGSLFDGEVYFEGAKFKGIVDLFSRFRGNVTLSAEFGQMKVKWEDLKRYLVPEEITFKYLVQNFKNQGYFDEADNCYYKYRLWMQEKRTDKFKKLTDAFYHLTCGYGVRPSFTLIWIVTLITFFAILYNFLNGVGYQEYINVYPLNNTIDRPSISDCIPYSTLVFLGQISEATGLAPVNVFWKYIVILEASLGYTFIAIFIALTIRQITKEL